ncbi:uncharacterized protein LOC143143605 isoform X2 [Ptiloglossa arizonensis]|uniref:uncharacterized protein LOC143143605 isoform X2 n=1 Tax=Ptiloglossa arizonensis TaxID=3350558 RepID=UPI003FA11DE2
MVSLRLKEGFEGIPQWSSLSSSSSSLSPSVWLLQDSLRSGSSGRRNVRNGRSFMTNPARVRTEQRRRRPEAGRDASSPVLVALDGEGKRVQPRSYFGRALPISRPKWLRA